jgi:hypothetical protein
MCTIWYVHACWEHELRLIATQKIQAVSISQMEPVNNKNLSIYGDPAALKEYAEDIQKVLTTHLYPDDVSSKDAAGIAEGIVNLEVEIVKAFVAPSVTDDNSVGDYESIGCLNANNC